MKLAVSYERAGEGGVPAALVRCLGREVIHLGVSVVSCGRVSAPAPAKGAVDVNAGGVAYQRIDRLVQQISKARDMNHAEVDATVAQVDARLQENRAKAD